MFLSIMRIAPAAHKEQEILDILLSIRGPTLAASGCLECSILREHDDEHAIVYLEKWRSRGEMLFHIRSPLYPRVLKALELAGSRPAISFHEVAATQGMELIEQERSSK